jgi:MinD superfamily P-loop ATPase
MEVPVVDEDLCTRCGKCSDFCQFNAISVMADTLLVFSEMCHGCGGCLALCPEGALSPGERELGVIEHGVFDNGRGGALPMLTGRLRVGEAMSPPLMRAVKERLSAKTEPGDVIPAGDFILDAPPGVSCPALAAVSGSDAILLVTEPTPFGLYDLGLAVESFRPLGVPMAVVVNRAGIGDQAVQAFCSQMGLPILAEIPYDRAVAEAYSRGEVVTGRSPELAALFASLRDKVRRLALREEPVS